MTRKILKPDDSYSFSRYFDLPFTLEDILLEFDCDVHRGLLPLPGGSAIDLSGLRQTLERNLRRTHLLNEASRREALISPVLLEVCDLSNQMLHIEYAISVDDYLKGTLDYYIASPTNLLVIEAKQSDLVKGFTQLAVELVALDRWTRSDCPWLYGVVSTGEVWQFGVFDRQEQLILQDTRTYALFNDLERLVDILLSILREN